MDELRYKIGEVLQRVRHSMDYPIEQAITDINGIMNEPCACTPSETTGNMTVTLCNICGREQPFKKNTMKIKFKIYDDAMPDHRSQGTHAERTESAEIIRSIQDKVGNTAVEIGFQPTLGMKIYLIAWASVYGFTESELELLERNDGDGFFEIGDISISPEGLEPELVQINEEQYRNRP